MAFYQRALIASSEAEANFLLSCQCSCSCHIIRRRGLKENYIKRFSSVISNPHIAWAARINSTEGSTKVTVKEMQMKQS